MACHSMHHILFSEYAYKIVAKSINEMNNNTKAITSFEALKEYLKKKPVSSYITEI